MENAECLNFPIIETIPSTAVHSIKCLYSRGCGQNLTCYFADAPQIKDRLALLSFFFVFAVNTLLNVKLSETEGGKYVSILDLPGNVLIIPQATLGGRLKGRRMQYHSNIEKERGMALYSLLVALCERELTSAAKCAESGAALKHGTYGNRQVLKVDTNGPFTHLIEF